LDLPSCTKPLLQYSVKKAEDTISVLSGACFFPVCR
jgi:hypothetical protein